MLPLRLRELSTEKGKSAVPVTGKSLRFDIAL